MGVWANVLVTLLKTRQALVWSGYNPDYRANTR